MTDAPPNGTQALPTATHQPFPLARLLYSIGFAIVGWFTLWVLFGLTLIQFAVLAINGHANAELKEISLRLVRYLMEVLAFVIFVRDEPPFPIGPMPPKS
jgi:Domain of unknown function (DUF4389)